MLLVGARKTVATLRSRVGAVRRVPHLRRCTYRQASPNRAIGPAEVHEEDIQFRGRRDGDSEDGPHRPHTTDRCNLQGMVHSSSPKEGTA